MKVYLVYENFGPHGKGMIFPLTSFDAAVEMCHRRSNYEVEENPLVQGRGWMFEEHVVDSETAPVAYYNGHGECVKSESRD